jgi:AcrR family transcriptional regulator
MNGTVGLRERKKAETREAVHEATLRLVMEFGLDNVTVEAIADAARISRRTFSNYFDSKEDALLYGDQQRLTEMVRRVREQPAGLSAWQALRAALDGFYDENGVPDRGWLIRTRLVRRHPSLLARQLANRVTLENELSQAVAGRAQPGGVGGLVLAAAFLTALRLATLQWITEYETRSMREIMDELLDQIAQPFG